MINAELNHNPYLLETSVMFNGQPPRINSQVEKYEHTMLKEWINRIPQIFYDEMNGYDFDFNFVGTKSDFISLQESFLRAGVSDEMVRLFHKNELEDAETKSAAIDALIEWLQNNKNRNFDSDKFFEEYQELFGGSISLYHYQWTCRRGYPSASKYGVRGRFRKNPGDRPHQRTCSTLCRSQFQKTGAGRLKAVA